MDSRTRAQTTLDFAIAMGIFLLAVSFVFTFIPSLTAPFVDGDQDQSVASDRVASHLSEGALGSPDEPFVVNQTCATVFFDESKQDYTAIPAGCGYNGTGHNERVGLSDRLDIQIELLHVDPEKTGSARYRVVCVDSSGNVIHEGTGTCETTYRIGEEPPDTESVTVARRVMTVPDCSFGADVQSCDVTLRVSVW
jgi:hypothetical protein